MNFGDLLALLYDAIMARKSIHIEMTLGNDHYVFDAAPEGTPRPNTINVGTYTSMV